MFAKVAADCLVVLHLGCICFVVFGGLLALKWRWVASVHVPAAIWGAALEFRGWICPLTPLEQHFRQAAGQRGYGGGFIEHYLVPIIYPAGLTPNLQYLLGCFVLGFNLALYGWMLYRRK